MLTRRQHRRTTKGITYEGNPEPASELSAVEEAQAILARAGSKLNTLGARRDVPELHRIGGILNTLAIKLPTYLEK